MILCSLQLQVSGDNLDVLLPMLQCIPGYFPCAKRPKTQDNTLVWLYHEMQLGVGGLSGRSSRGTHVMLYCYVKPTDPRYALKCCQCPLTPSLTLRRMVPVLAASLYCTQQPCYCFISSISAATTKTLSNA